MDSSSAQEMGSQTLESMVVIGTKAQQEKKSTIRVGDQQPQNCPRCDSTNTKFCYYNNYSLSQPRYFCKSCRRYWTKGGTLRNVPVGGGCRKNKRSSSSSSSSKRSNQDNNDQPMPTAVPSPNIHCFNNPHPSYDSNDHFSMYGNPNMPLGGVFDALRGGILETPRGFQNLYYGMGDGISLGMGISSGLSQEMGAMGFDQNFSGATAAKQEICGGGESSRGMWGFPWQNGSTNGGDGNIGEFDSGRVGGWNGIASSNWHGLLNSPLM